MRPSGHVRINPGRRALSLPVYKTARSLHIPLCVVTMALSKPERHQNGVTKTRKVPRSDAGFRKASVGYIAAIDFGTTYCSVAYILQDSDEILKLPLDGPRTRVPNAILIKKEGNIVAAFGYYAQEKFSRLQKNERKNYMYFERMKMILYRTPVSLH